MPDDSIHHPTDKLFKQGFNDPETAAGFLSAYLPEALASVERHVHAIQTGPLRNTAMTLAQKLRQEGHQEGQILAQQRAVLDALEIRFQRVPAGLEEAIKQIDETPRLQSLLRAAIQAPTLEEFTSAL